MVVGPLLVLVLAVGKAVSGFTKADDVADKVGFRIPLSSILPPAVSHVGVEVGAAYLVEGVSHGRWSFVGFSKRMLDQGGAYVKYIVLKKLYNFISQ